MTKNKKWYHLTLDAFINFLYQVGFCEIRTDYNAWSCIANQLLLTLFVGSQREIAKSQEEAIRQYRDSLVSGDGKMSQGSSEKLIQLASEAVKKTKTLLHTDMARHLAIADPRNGAEFINEVQNPSTLVAFSLDCSSSFGSFVSERPLRACVIFLKSCRTLEISFTLVTLNVFNGHKI